MASNAFQNKVRQELKNLNKEQLVQFAWCCAVRSLPFLAKDGNFNFWNNKDRQKHIYAVLKAIDFASASASAVMPFT